MDNDEVRLASGLKVMSAEPGSEVNGKVSFGVSGEWDSKTPDEAGLVTKAGVQTSRLLQQFTRNISNPITTVLAKDRRSGF